MGVREKGGQNCGLAQPGTGPGGHKSKKSLGVRDRLPQEMVFLWRCWTINSHFLFSPCAESPILSAKAPSRKREPGWGQQPFNQSFPISRLDLSRQDILSQKSKILLWRGSMVQSSWCWPTPLSMTTPSLVMLRAPGACPVALCPSPLAQVCPTSPDLSNRQRKVLSLLPCGYCHPSPPAPGLQCSLHKHRINPQLLLSPQSSFSSVPCLSLKPSDRSCQCHE